MFAAQAGIAEAGTVTGQLEKWAPITVDFTGPTADESDIAPNPFLDYRLTVAFTSPTGNVHQVPGFFAGDGLGGDSGNQWRVRFAADEVGQWRYQATLVSDPQIAVDTDLSAGKSVSIEGPSGEFTVQAQASDAPGFLAHGRLEYTGEHYLKFRDGPYWIKSGTDSPENFLGYAGIDGTVDQGGSQFLHDFSTHRGDARSDDPVFSNSSSGADSLGITGALNYLSDQGVNSIYFLPMNLGGDGQETYPFVGGAKNSFNKTHYDISKLYQWNQVLAHAQRRGIALNIQLSETEPGNERWLDDGKLGVERKLFFRELIARFGYLLAAKWNLGEENDYPVSELRAQAGYLNSLDWTKKPIAVHTQINNFRDYEELVGDDLFSASSIQYDPPLAGEFVETWRKRSADAGRSWVIDMDENTGGITNANADTRRKQILYDVYFSGGNIEWYYGYHPLPLGGDLTAGDFRQRDAIWTTMRHARNFMQSQLPFWRMQPADELVTGEANSFGGAEVFAVPGEIYAIYLPNASGNPSLDMRSASGSFSLQWFNPRNGQFEGETKNVIGGERLAIGNPPSSSNNDWVVLVKSHNAPALPDFGRVTSSPSTTTPAQESTDEQAAEEPEQTPEASEQAAEEPVSDTVSDSLTEADPVETGDEQQEQEPTTQTEQSSINKPPVFLNVAELPAAIPGEVYTFNISATDPDGVAPVVTAENLPAGMKFSRVADGIASLEWQVPDQSDGSVTFELVAIDVQDNTLRTTLSVTIAVEVAVSDAAQEETATTETPTEETPSDETPADETPADVSEDTASASVPPENAEPADEPLDDDTAVQTDSSIGMEPVASSDLPPIVVGTEDLRIVAGQTIRNTVVPVDPEGIVASLRLDSVLTGIELIDNGNGSRDLVWTPAESDVGTHELRFVATDSGATPHVVQQLMTIEVISANDAADDGLTTNPSEKTNFEPIFVPLNDQEVQAGNTVSFKVNPIDPDGSPPILHVNSPPEGALFNDNGDGSRTFSWVVPDNFTGNVLLQFTATDSEDLSATVQQEVLIKVLP